MSTILAILIFGAMAAFCIYGFTRSNKMASARSSGDFSSGDPFAMVASRDQTKDSPSSKSGGGSSPDRKTEDHAALSEVTHPRGNASGETGYHGASQGDVGKQRPQADRPLTSGDAGA